MKISVELGATVKVKDSFYKLTLTASDIDPERNIQEQIESAKEGISGIYEYLTSELEEKLMSQIETVNEKVRK